MELISIMGVLDIKGNILLGNKEWKTAFINNFFFLLFAVEFLMKYLTYALHGLVQQFSQALFTAPVMEFQLKLYVHWLNPLT